MWLLLSKLSSLKHVTAISSTTASDTTFAAKHCWLRSLNKLSMPCCSCCSREFLEERLVTYGWRGGHTCERKYITSPAIAFLQDLELLLLFITVPYLAAWVMSYRSLRKFSLCLVSWAVLWSLVSILRRFLLFHRWVISMISRVVSCTPSYCCPTFNTCSSCKSVVWILLWNSLVSRARFTVTFAKVHVRSSFIEVLFCDFLQDWIRNQWRPAYCTLLQLSSCCC